MTEQVTADSIIDFIQDEIDRVNGTDGNLSRRLIELKSTVVTIASGLENNVNHQFRPSYQTDWKYNLQLVKAYGRKTGSVEVKCERLLNGTGDYF